MKQVQEHYYSPAPPPPPPPPPWMGCYRVVHCRVTSIILSPVPINTPWWRERQCGVKVSAESRPKVQHANHYIVYNK